MTPPRPTMTPEDVRKLREFFDSPAGKRMLGQINRAFDVRPIVNDQPEAYWRDSLTGQRLDIPSDLEAASADPLDPFRPFPAPKPPRPVDHRVSRRLVIIATILSTTACAGLIARFVSAALKAYQ